MYITCTRNFCGNKLFLTNCGRFCETLALLPVYLYFYDFFGRFALGFNPSLCDFIWFFGPYFFKKSSIPPVAIKNALKQENLNPEIEEKLLQLQRYQERQMKHEPECPPPVPKPAVAPALAATPNRYPAASRKRPASTSRNDDDADWVMDQPKRSRPSKNNEVRKTEVSPQ